MLIIPRRHLSVPDTPVIDLNNDLGRRILGGVAFSQGRAHMHRMALRAATDPLALVGGVTSFGGAADETVLPINQYNEFLFERGDYSGESSDWTMLAMVRWVAGGSQTNKVLAGLSITGGAATETPYVCVHAHYTSGIRGYHRGSSYVATPWVTPPELTPVAVVFRQGVGLSLYYGPIEPTFNASGATGFYGGGQSTQGGIFFGGGTGGGRASFAYAIPEAIDDLTLREWLRQPFQLFKQPEPTRIYLLPSGGSGVTVEPVTGHIEVVGHTPGVAQPITVTPSTGHVSATGYATAVVQSLTVAPAAGHLTLSGHAPGVVQPRTVAPLKGSLTVTGHAPEVVQGNGLSVAPATGHIVVSGHAPGVSQPITVAPSTGHTVVSGHTPVVSQGAGQAVAPGAGHIALAGYAPSLLQPRTVRPGAGAVSVSGHAPMVSQVAATPPNPPADRIYCVPYASRILALEYHSRILRI